MLAASSAVGLGNVWRFPYIVGRNGGAAFVLVYLAFLVLIGFPLLVVELGIGRGAQRSLAAALPALAPPRTAAFWRRLGTLLSSGCFVLMIYYTDVAGWLLKYTGDFARGHLAANPESAFAALLADRPTCAAALAVVVVLATAVCLAGVVKGIERVTKALMLSLLVLLAAGSCGRARLLPEARLGRVPGASGIRDRGRDGPGLLHALARHRLDDHLRQLRRR